MSKIYMCEIVTADNKQGTKNTFIYEGQDVFSDERGKQYKGKDLESILLNAINKGWKCEGYTKDGVKADIYKDKFGLQVHYKQ